MFALGCGGGVRVNDDPRMPTNTTNEKPPAPREGSLDLPSQEQLVEPDHPLVDTKPERATVHVHTPRTVCSGVMLGQRVVVTARRCLPRDLRGAQPLGQKEQQDYKVEIASSNLTWTTRRISHTVTAACDRRGLDVAVLILAEPAQWVQPLRIISAPGPGAKVEALGFGRCRNNNGNAREAAVISRASEDFVLDLRLCKGDVGGPVVDGPEGEIAGIISHDDDPDDSPRKTTSIARMDTTPARNLVAQGEKISKGADPKGEAPVTCE